MSLIGLEISDAGIMAAEGVPAGLIQRKGRHLESPGFAMQDGKSLLVGRAAEERARLYPRQTINSFWDSLDSEPLTQPGFTASSHAEIAYEHLKHLLKLTRVGDKDVVFAVPGFYTNHNMGLLLGMTRELGIRVRGLTTIPLMAAKPLEAGELLHVDIHLHRCEVTYLKKEAMLSQVDTVSSSGSGLDGLYRAWVQGIAGDFLNETRFDLFHSSASEQAVYSRLPTVLSNLMHNNTVTFALNAGDRTYQTAVDRQRMIGHAQPVYATIKKLISTLQQKHRMAGRPTVLQLSHRISGLPGLKDALSQIDHTETIDLPTGSAALGTVTHWPLIPGQQNGKEAPFIRHRPLVPRPTADGLPGRGAGYPTHLLVHDFAYPIGPDPIAIGGRPDTGTRTIPVSVGLTAQTRHYGEVRLTESGVVLENPNGLEIFVDGICVEGRTNLKLGQTIQVGTAGEAIRLIACLGRDET